MLHSFNYSTDGANPDFESLLLGLDGDFYGMTYYGGTYGFGTVFKIAPSGTLTVLHNFNGSTDGGNAGGGINLGLDGNLYGMTANGGANGYGTVFKLQVTW